MGVDASDPLKVYFVVAVVQKTSPSTFCPIETLLRQSHTSYSSIGTSGPCLTFNFHTIRVKQYVYISR